MKAALPPPPPKPAQPENEGGEPPTPVPQNDSGQDAAQDEKSKEDDAPASTMRDAAGKPIPDVAAEMIVLRRGYSNYFFNLNQQTKFIDRLRAEYAGIGFQGKQVKPAGWVIGGEATTADDGKRRLFEITVGADSVELKLGEKTEVIQTNGDLSRLVDSQGTVGMVAAIHAWHRMLMLSPSRFGETFYWGSAPLGGQWPLRDCTYGIHAGVESRFFQHPETGQLECIEAFADRDLDPVELWIDSNMPATDQTRAHPERLELRYGEESMMTFEIKNWQTVVSDSAEANSP